MKWGKALTSLIIVFIILNMVLAVWNYDKNVSAYRITQGNINTITKLLEAKGITLAMPLPTSFKPQKSIWIVPVELTTQIRDNLVKNLLGTDTSQITISKEISQTPYENPSRMYTKGKEYLKFQDNHIVYENKAFFSPKLRATTKLTKEQILNLAKSFVEKIHIKDNFNDVEIEYITEPYGGRVIYYELQEGKPIFNSYIHMKVNEKGVFKAYIHALDVEMIKTSPKSIYPIDRVLLTLQDTLKDMSPVTISSIELGYAMETAQGMHILKEEAIPMYKILVEGLEVPLFVNAYTNTRKEGPWEK